ncbi:MAG TPA: cation diffusion facilitator family transporter [Dehalococcoidia bacterium]|jgi:cation diffusion facilitator family transporter
MSQQRKKSSVAALSVASNSVLVVFKLIVGLLIGSVSVLSEAIHSGMDLIAALIAFFAVRIAGRAADEEHPFGHTKVENISAAVEALLIFAAAIWIIFEAVQKLIHPRPLETVGWGVGIMLVSTIANLIVSQRLFKVGKETDSAALIADGWHLRTDVYTSAGVMVGLGIIWLGARLFPGLNLSWIDPLAAIAVAGLIIHAAYDLTRKAVQDLVDQSMPVEEKEWMENYLSSLYPTVRSFHRLRTRKAGATRFINLHLALDSNLTVAESHSIGDKIVADFKLHFPHDVDVIVHIEPCDGACSPACESGCLLSHEEKKAARGGEVSHK